MISKVLLLISLLAAFGLIVLLLNRSIMRRDRGVGWAVPTKYLQCVRLLYWVSLFRAVAFVGLVLYVLGSFARFFVQVFQGIRELIGTIEPTGEPTWLVVLNLVGFVVMIVSMVTVKDWLRFIKIRVDDYGNCVLFRPFPRTESRIARRLLVPSIARYLRVLLVESDGYIETPPDGGWTIVPLVNLDADTEKFDDEYWKDGVENLVEHCQVAALDVSRPSDAILYEAALVLSRLPRDRVFFLANSSVTKEHVMEWLRSSSHTRVRAAAESLHLVRYDTLPFGRLRLARRLKPFFVSVMDVPLSPNSEELIDEVLDCLKISKNDVNSEAIAKALDGPWVRIDRPLAAWRLWTWVCLGSESGRAALSASEPIQEWLGVRCA